MTAYEQVENALLPTLRWSGMGRRGMSRNVLRLTLFHWPNAMPQSDTVANQRDIHDLSNVVKERVKTDCFEVFGYSAFWTLLILFLIQKAIELLLEWWMDRDKHNLMRDAINEMRAAKLAGRF